MADNTSKVSGSQSWLCSGVTKGAFEDSEAELTSQARLNHNLWEQDPGSSIFPDNFEVQPKWRATGLGLNNKYL